MIKLNSIIDDLKNNLDELGKKEVIISQIADKLYKCLKYGGTIYVIGNGGSSADAIHFSAELTGRFKKERKAYSCIALNTDIAAMTAISNDYGFENVFSRQLEGLYNINDVLLTFSTSGNSENIIRSIEYVAERSGTSINILGGDGGKTNNLNLQGQTNLIVPGIGSDRIQELQKVLIHYFAEYIEENM